jgi:hypothetical protein
MLQQKGRDHSRWSLLFLAQNPATCTGDNFQKKLMIEFKIKKEYDIYIQLIQNN